MNITTNRLTLLWLLSDETGISSKTICAAFFEAPILERYGNHPHDPSDFFRCKQFLDTLSASEKEQALLKVKKISPQWCALVDNWDQLEHISDDSNLYEEMQKVLIKAGTGE